MCGRAGRLTGAPLGCKQQAARWGEASSRTGRQDEGEAAMQTREAGREKQVGQPRQCSSKMGRSKLGKMGEEQLAAMQTGEASSKMGEAWQARRDKEQAAIKMGETQASSKRGKMGEAVSSNAG